jgi:hypothetical protein
MITFADDHAAYSRHLSVRIDKHTDSYFQPIYPTYFGYQVKL